jgi:hypothetical protein
MRCDPAVRLLILLTTLNLTASPEPPGTNFVPVPRAKLCVTEGAIDALPGPRLSIDVPKMRAYLNESTPQAVQAHFTYLGPTANPSRLGSGAVRTQFGFKLHAQDACNLVYAMWRIEAESQLVVSVKSNPGQHTSAQCANHGYQNVKPERSRPVPVLHPGDTHWFRAEMNGPELTVFVDNSPVWEGSIPPVALGFNGPVGIRSDNTRLQLELRAPQPQANPPGPSPACRTGAEELE